MKIAEGKMNHQKFWGVKVRGVAYGKTVLMEPETDEPLLGHIDTGSTLINMPVMAF